MNAAKTAYSRATKCPLTSHHPPMSRRIAGHKYERLGAGPCRCRIDDYQELSAGTARALAMSQAARCPKVRAMWRATFSAVS